MQELWALLHFIMPTLFDSHDEFSDWFSKDIESHAENKGTLNEHQLGRLHMILKPFMLRRIKKHVQHELGDKIEIELSCHLSARQRNLYRTLREKISLAELLRKVESSSSSNGGDSDNVDSLMNLVMQFRKVCNHPELFERAEASFPFSSSYFGMAASLTREGDTLEYSYSTRGMARFHLPRLLYRDEGYTGHGRPSTIETKYLDRLMNIWRDDYVHQSSWEANGAFAFLRLADVEETPSMVTRIFHGNLLERARIHAEMERKKAARHAAVDDETSPLPRELVSISRDTALDPLPCVIGCYHPRAVSAPCELVCSDTRFAQEQQALSLDMELVTAIRGQAGTADYLRCTEATSMTAQEPSRWAATPLMQELSTIYVPPLARLVQDSGKLQRLDRLLAELKAGGHRVLIYFQMTRMIDLMEEYLAYRRYTYLRLDGSSKIEDRRDMVSDWQTKDEIFIFLLSTRAGGLGINLTAADTVIFYDSDWNPTVDQQAMDRAHRLGQTRQVTVYRLITAGTIEERILNRAKQKDEIQKVVIAGGDFRPVEFKSREIVSLLMEDA
ncbi:P-loop containing nucleoside triphosphate hydrolase protein [Syncephalis pseudoplumigaleata]|uniref:Chromatin-remodeling ATPase INO80 n=1 Tax=Syncephalis pseudoplumigaleata TaxID=1712513 RepID=A0A4P9YV86_9FUNG|nr:P-loop containing nucleoside triphosphate hydrolase protein [Syncephalis pseudoplumigaleata]|eukprot:RKP23926.1 P-loop containing nucleoside triphosphate hydrolase protein [Syncephalis pseudoplumigaleata]